MTISKELKTQVYEVYETAKKYGERTEDPVSLIAFQTELDAIDLFVDHATDLQDELFQVEDSIFNAELSDLHNRIYDISQLAKKRIKQLTAYGERMNPVNLMIAEFEERLRTLNAKEEELLQMDTMLVMDELQKILKEKQIIQNELDRWVN